jgi:hypothetical protein
MTRTGSHPCVQLRSARAHPLADRPGRQRPGRHRLTASLAGGIPIDLREVLAGLDPLTSTTSIY